MNFMHFPKSSMCSEHTNSGRIWTWITDSIFLTVQPPTPDLNLDTSKVCTENDLKYITKNFFSIEYVFLIFFQIDLN